MSHRLLIRNTARLVGTDVIEPSVLRTFLALWLAATRIFPALSNVMVRGTKPCVSAFCMSVGSPVALSIEKTATLFSPPRKTGGVPVGAVVAIADVHESTVVAHLDRTDHLGRERSTRCC